MPEAAADVKARIDERIQVTYTGDSEASIIPGGDAAPGRIGGGATQSKRTLASFSLEGRVVVVTGGAGGLGLVMSQAIVESGADVALVDINSGLASPFLKFTCAIIPGRWKNKLEGKVQARARKW